MTLGEKIKTLRLRRGLTQEDLAKALDTTKQTIYKYETAKVTNLPIDRIEQLARALDTTPAYLMGWENGEGEPTQPSFRNEAYEPLPATKQVPFRGDIACGVPILASDDVSEYFSMPANIRADFCLRCKGDSMIGARIFDGDIVYIRSQPDVETGEIAAVEIDGEATLKRIYKFCMAGHLHAIELRAENPSVAHMYFEGIDMNRIRIDGKAVYFTSVVR